MWRKFSQLFVVDWLMVLKWYPCYLIWQKRTADVTKLRILKWRDYPELARWVFNEITCIHNPSYKRGRQRVIREVEKAMWPWRQTLDWCFHNPRKPGIHQKLEEARNGFSCRASQGGVAWPTLPFQCSETDNGLLASINVRKQISVVLSNYLVITCGNLL